MNLFESFSNFVSGFTLDNPKQKAEQKIIQRSPVIAVDANDDSTVVESAHFGYTSYAGIEQNFQSQSQLIDAYRTMALHHEVDGVVDDIVNAIIVADDDEKPVSIMLDTLEAPESIKTKLIDEWNNISDLLELESSAYEKVRGWYVDGRQSFHVVIDENAPKRGILKLVYLDPRALQRVKEVKKELDPKTHIERVTGIRSYYLYNGAYSKNKQRQQSMGVYTAVTASSNSLELTDDSVVMVTSGVVDPSSGFVLSHLESARKPLNNLTMIEDALVIYRITSAAEKRMFYIDTGTMPKKQAEEYVTGMMRKYRNRMTYDTKTGEIKGQAHTATLMEDFWLPRMEGSRATEIETLQGGANLGEMDDVFYFLKRLYKSMKIPVSRIEPDAAMVIGGRQSEINRDEWKFNKFVNRLRKRYSGLFIDLLRRQVILKKIMTPDEWDEIESQIRFQFASDSFQQDAIEAEKMSERMDMLSRVKEHEGKYVSREFIYRNILKMTDEEIEIEKSRMDEERAAGVYDAASDEEQPPDGF